MLYTLRETTAKQQTRIIGIDCRKWVTTSHITGDWLLPDPSNSLVFHQTALQKRELS